MDRAFDLSVRLWAGKRKGRRTDCRLPARPPADALQGPNCSTPIERVAVGVTSDLPEAASSLRRPKRFPVEIPANGGALSGPITPSERLSSHYVKLSL